MFEKNSLVPYVIEQNPQIKTKIQSIARIVFLFCNIM